MAEQSQYTDPELRERLKAEITAGDRGGRPGQWSARKAQLLASEYKKAGGGYTSDKAHESEDARHLDQWSDEEWQTEAGDTRARAGKETKRYLPKEAWEKLSDEEKRETDQLKRVRSRQGEQFVPNTAAAKQAGRDAREHGDEAEPAAKRAGSATREHDGEAEPFDGYAESTAKDIVKRVRGLDDEVLRRVRRFEREHDRRKTVLQRVEKALDD
jgi:hypothetical protein